MPLPSGSTAPVLRCRKCSMPVWIVQQSLQRGMGTMADQNSALTKEQQVRGLIEQLNAYIETYHGGSVELVSFDGKGRARPAGVAHVSVARFHRLH